MKAKCSRHKRLNKAGRLQAAKYWLPKYEGKSIVKGYSKHSGVNKFCAVIELRILGYEISEEYLEKLKVDELQKQRLAEKRKREKEINLCKSIIPYFDDTFFFDSGYTTNDARYSLKNNRLGYESDDFCGEIDSEELPFC